MSEGREIRARERAVTFLKCTCIQLLADGTGRTIVVDVASWWTSSWLIIQTLNSMAFQLCGRLQCPTSWPTGSPLRRQRSTINILAVSRHRRLFTVHSGPWTRSSSRMWPGEVVCSLSAIDVVWFYSRASVMSRSQTSTDAESDLSWTSSPRCWRWNGGTTVSTLLILTYLWFGGVTAVGQTGDSEVSGSIPARCTAG